jgi:SulP family sulfate permease
MPELIPALRGYTRRQAVLDITSGIIVGVVALPLAIAFAIASGLSPEYGLYTAIVAGFLISALGGSRVQIGGPTGAFVVIVYGVVQRHGIEGLALATMMAGLLLIVLGVARLGTVIKFIPFPVTLGFTSGIAVVIFSSQIGDLLGLETGPVPAEFLAKWGTYAAHLDSLDLPTAGVALLSLAIVLGWPKVSRRLPSPFVAIVAMTALVRLTGLEVQTIGSRFGAIPAAFPAPRLPAVELAALSSLAGSAFAIAMLGAIESLLSAVIADGMTGSRHRSNAELVAQGVANIAAPLFGGMPATGAIARTAANIRNGGRTPVAGMVHALTLLLITLFFGRWAAWIPMATLAAILVVVAWHMGEWRRFRAEFSAPRSDILVLVTTFTLTVIVDLTVAIQVGMVLAAFLFMRRMSEVTNVAAVTAEFAGHPAAGESAPSVPAGVEIYEINGPFFFGAAEKFKDTMATIAKPPRVLILRMRDVLTMDSTGMHALRDLIRRTRRDRTVVLLSEVRSQPLMAMGRSRLLDEIGDDNLCGSVEEALGRARAHLGG